MNRIFLVGCARSGTTLVQAMICNRLPIISFPETQFFTEAFGDKKQRVYGRKTSFTRRLKNRLGYVGSRRETLRHSVDDISMELLGQHCQTCDHLFFRAYVEAFIAVLDRKAIQNGEAAWLEKSPNHIYYLNEIQRVVPDAKFIHILRNGEDVVASIVDATRRFPRRVDGRTVHDFDDDPDLCVSRWNAAAEAHRAAMGRGGHYFMRYERLIAAPDAEMRRVAGFLGIDANDMRQTQLNQSEKQVWSRSFEKWKDRSGDGVIHPPESKFRKIFTRQQQAEILSRLHPAPY